MNLFSFKVKLYEHDGTTSEKSFTTYKESRCFFETKRMSTIYKHGEHVQIRNGSDIDILDQF